MWGRKKPDEGNQLPGLSAGLTGATKGRMAAELGANLDMKGEITGSQDLVIEGTFEGLIHLDEGKLMIGTTGKVTADIVASEVIVWGRVKGNVRAKNRIEIKKEGAVTGDITTQQILIEVGAFYKGSIDTESDGVEKRVDRSALSSVKPASTPPTRLPH